MTGLVGDRPVKSCSTVEEEAGVFKMGGLAWEAEATVEPVLDLEGVSSAMALVPLSCELS